MARRLRCGQGQVPGASAQLRRSKRYFNALGEEIDRWEIHEWFLQEGECVALWVIVWSGDHSPVGAAEAG